MPDADHPLGRCERKKLKARETIRREARVFAGALVGAMTCVVDEVPTSVEGIFFGGPRR